MEPRRVLVIGDGSVPQMFVQTARLLGHDAELGSVASARELAHEFQPDVIVPDLGTNNADAVAWVIRCDLKRKLYVAAIADSLDQRVMGTNDRILGPLGVDVVRAALERASITLARA